MQFYGFSPKESDRDEITYLEGYYDEGSERLNSISSVLSSFHLHGSIIGNSFNSP